MTFIAWGFDAARLGALTCTLTETGGGAATGSVSLSGQYVHHIALGTYTTEDPITGESETRDTGYVNFADALEDALNAIGNATYAVVFDPAGPGYTITASGGSVTAFALTSISTSLRRALGLTVSSLSGALSYDCTDYATGATRPLWHWSAPDIGISEWSESEDDIDGEDLIGSEGEVTGLVALGAAHRVDFVVPWEAVDKIWNANADSSDDWTWQRALARARTVEPFWLSPDPRGGATKAVVATMRRDGCTLRPRLASADYLGHQSVPIGAWVHGVADVGGTTPIEIFGSKLLSWHRADLGVTLSGSDVTTWADQSGNGRTFTAAVGQRPTMGTMSGQTALAFAGASSQRLSLSGTSYGSPSALHVIRVMQRNADPPSTSSRSGLDDFGTHAAKSHVPFTDGVVYDSTGGASSRATVGNPTPSFASPRVYESISTASKFEAKLDGTTIFGPSTTLGVGVAATPIIGGTTAGAYMDGYIAEHIVLNAEASVSERSALAAYILDRYGLTIV